MAKLKQRWIDSFGREHETQEAADEYDRLYGFPRLAARFHYSSEFGRQGVWFLIDRHVLAGGFGYYTHEVEHIELKTDQETVSELVADIRRFADHIEATCRDHQVQFLGRQGFNETYQREGRYG